MDDACFTASFSNVTLHVRHEQSLRANSGANQFAPAALSSMCRSSFHNLLPSKGRYHDAADVACLLLLLLQQSGYCG